MYPRVQRSLIPGSVAPFDEATPEISLSLYPRTGRGRQHFRLPASPPLTLEHDLAEMLATFQVAEGFRRRVEGKYPVDDGVQLVHFDGAA